MSVCLDPIETGRVFTAADGIVTPEGLTVTLAGSGPRRAAVFVNEAVVETDADGRFEAEVTLPPGAGWIVAGILVGCACVTQKVAVTVQV